jgi:mycothiol S-conjugate amidase
VTRRLLAVHAHPDDESSKGAATYARYAAAGAIVTVVSCTGGERGDVQNAALEPRAMAERDMAGLRRLEMAAAQRVLGIEHRWLGYVDSGLPDDYTRDRSDLLPAGCFALVPLEISAEPLVRVIRQTRPQVLVTYDEDGGYPHPDHIRTHELAMYAWEAAADPGRYPEQGAPWRVAKVYYDRIFNSHRVAAVYDALVAAGHERAADLAEMSEWMRERPDLATTHVPVGDHLDTRDAALRSHASQVAPDDRFFFLPNDVQREAWPYEDFQLVESSVETALPESDLFAGIDPSEEDEQ